MPPGNSAFPRERFPVGSRVRSGGSRRYLRTADSQRLSLSCRWAPPAAVSAALVRSAVLATRGTSTAVASAAASAVVKGMLFEQLRATVLAAGLILTAVCGGWAMTGASEGNGPLTAPAPSRTDDSAARLVELLGSEEFAERESAQKALRKLGTKAESAIKAGIRSKNPEIVKRCDELLATLRSDLLRSKDSPVWHRFKSVAGDDDQAWKLYLRMVTNRSRGEMLLNAVRDPKAAAASYATEADRAQRGAMAPRTDETPIVTGDDIAALLFLGLMSRGEQKEEDEMPGVVSYFLMGLVSGEDKMAFGKLYTAWTEPRPAAWRAGLFRAMASKNIPSMVGVARKALAAKNRVHGTYELVLALHITGRHGNAADLPLVMAYADDATESGRAEFSKYPGGVIRGFGGASDNRPRVKDSDLVVQVRDVAVIAAICIHKQKPQDFGFELDLLPIDSQVMTSDLSQYGFCRDADRAAAHKKAREWLAEQKKEPTFDEQVKKAEAEVERLGLVEISRFKDGIATSFPIRFDGKGGEVQVPAGSARLVELTKPTRAMTWASGSNRPEGIGDKDGPEFSHLLCKWAADGKLVWVMYRKKEKLDPIVLKLIDQLGSEDFAIREAAQKALRELGSKAESALKAGLASENPEVVKRCRELLDQIARDGFFARHWPRFSKVVGEDPPSRNLFDRIRSLRRNVELLDAVAAAPDSAGKLYHDRWKELNAASRTPNGPGSFLLSAAPLADVVGWMYLGTFPGAEGSHHQSSSLDFLPVSFHSTSRDPLPLALKDKESSAALRRLVGKWTAARTDYVGRDFGLQLALAYDIAEVLPAARSTLTAKVKDDPYPGNTARNVGFALLTIGKLGTKEDLSLLEKYETNETQCAAFLHDPPPKPGQPAFHLIRPPIEGQDTTTQLRDVSVAMRLHRLGQKAEDFGFHWSWPYGTEAGMPNKLGTFHLHAIGFLRKSDREAAHKKANEWLDKQKK